MIETTAEAIKHLKSIGFFVRVATLEEKRPLAREAKTKAHAPRRYASAEARDIHDNFCKVCYAVFKGGYFWGFYGPRKLIELAKEHAITEFCMDVEFPSFRRSKAKYKRYCHKEARREGTKVIHERLNEIDQIHYDKQKEWAKVEKDFEDSLICRGRYALEDFGFQIMDDLDYDPVDFME